MRGQAMGFAYWLELLQLLRQRGLLAAEVPSSEDADSADYTITITDKGARELEALTSAAASSAQPGAMAVTRRVACSRSMLEAAHAHTDIRDAQRLVARVRAARDGRRC